MVFITSVRSNQDLRPIAGANPRPGEPQPMEVPPGMPVEVPPVPPPELLGVQHCIIGYFCHYYTGGSDWIYGPVVMNVKRRAESGKA
ncbi:MAG: hypothetical protein BMS9Abin33_1237 [Gammaproteobacteria bacterium]|nr:MAG: hypothetical protein BMS9Abin33_1237 [Gammaproteobacteria bacterium]